MPESPIEAQLLEALRPLFPGPANGVRAIGSSIHGTLYEQYEVGPYRLDFAIVRSSGLSINIEADGHEYHHANAEQVLRDGRRDRYLSLLHWYTVRFSGALIHHNVEECSLYLQQLLRLWGPDNHDGVQPPDITADAQTRSLARVRGKIEDYVLAFARERIASGQREYHGDDLLEYVVLRARCAPDSARRIASECKTKHNLLGYTLLNRDQSLFRIDWVDTPPPPGHAPATRFERINEDEPAPPVETAPEPPLEDPFIDDIVNQFKAGIG